MVGGRLSRNVRFLVNKSCDAILSQKMFLYFYSHLSTALALRQTRILLLYVLARLNEMYCFPRSG